MFKQTALFAARGDTEALPCVVLNQCGEEVAPLTAEEEKALKQLELTVSRGINSFISVGTALMKIKGETETPSNERLYRMVSTNWGEYCKRMWGIRRSYADYTIEAVRVTNNLKRSREYRDDPSLYTLPENEVQARPLAKLEPDEQIKVWNAVLEVVKGESGQELTGSLVKRVAAEMFADRFTTEIELQERRKEQTRRLTILRERPEIIRSIDTFLLTMGTECSLQELIALLQERSRESSK